ncbi:hypothetical protein ACWGQ5_54910, partial [Streptomyces sp. NPDC055722]
MDSTIARAHQQAVGARKKGICSHVLCTQVGFSSRGQTCSSRWHRWHGATVAQAVERRRAYRRRVSVMDDLIQWLRVQLDEDARIAR